jgi:outer membrane protein TolC
MGVLCLLTALALTACSSRHYLKSADKEAYGIIKSKSPMVPNMEKGFTIATNSLLSMDGLTTISDSDPLLGTEGEFEKGAKLISLEKALEIAVKNSRTYQNRKETLYLSALDLTLARHRFTPIFSSGVKADYQRTSVDVRNGVDTIVEHDNQVTASSGSGVNMLLNTGGKIASSVTIDFFRFIDGDPKFFLSPAVGATFSQPLLRGRGYKATMENLTQAERSFLYSIREFVQFRKDFSVQIASAYYRVLQNRDSARNEFSRSQSFKKNADRTRALTDEARAPRADLGRIEQESLGTEMSLNNALNNYKQGLDQFKIQLGLPTDARIVLDAKELTKLQIARPNITIPEAVKVAMANRLDFYTQKDQLQDASRKIPLAKQGLQPDLDLVLNANVNSEPGSGIQGLDFKRATWGGGVNLDLPLDRKAQRNTYRASLIAYEQTVRKLELAMDQIKLDVYDGWRQLDTAERNYKSSLLAVGLSEKRVEEQNLLADLGRATAKDQVDAQNDLTRSKNDLIGALVNHTIARLQFWKALGILTIQESGQWEEVNDVKDK